MKQIRISSGFEKSHEQRGNVSSLEDALADAWDSVFYSFPGVIIHTTPLLVKDYKVKTAEFDFANRQIKVQEQFIDLLAQHGLDTTSALEGVLKHELGHYVLCPRELSTFLYLAMLSRAQWQEKAPDILNYHLDGMLNIHLMLEETGGKDLRAVYRTMNAISAKSQTGAALDRLMTLLYQHHTIGKFVDDDLGEKKLIATFKALQKEEITLEEKARENKKTYFRSRAKPGDAPIEQILCERMIDLAMTDFSIYKNSEYGVDSQVFRNAHDLWPELLRFGDAVQDLLANKPQIPGTEPKTGSRDSKKGKPRPGSHGHHGMWVNDFTDSQISDALNDIIKKQGKRTYDALRDFVAKERGKDPEPPTPVPKRAGLERTEINWNDNCIPFYARKAIEFGIPIVKKPLKVERNDMYPARNREFSIGDSMNQWNRFHGGRKLLPGISKQREYVPSLHADRKFKVPDAVIYLDTSGSMQDPKLDSPAVTASFVIANAYHANGCRVGVVNFSVDTLMLKPTRDLNDVYSFLCAYWGGGTLLDIERIKKYFSELARNKDPRARYLSTEKKMTKDDYEAAAQHLDREEKDALYAKEVLTTTAPELNEVYQGIDNLMITDSDIGNIEDLVSHMNELATVTRNGIFVVRNTERAKQWRKLKLPNTTVYDVGEGKDFAGWVIGEVFNQIQPKTNKFGVGLLQ